MPPIALVGAALSVLLGFSFCGGGFDVLVYDAYPGSAVKAVDLVRSALNDLKAQGLVFDGSPDVSLPQKPTFQLEDAPQAVEYVQEKRA